jgi:glycosyltransferase involved in cell wall biosynthesis
LVLAGLRGETYAELTALGDRLGIAGSLRFPGQVDDVAGLLTAADIGVFCSRSEGSPNGLLECMATGLPVVATDIPGVREALGEGAVDVLSSPGDAPAMAANLLSLARSPATRVRLGEGNQQRVHTCYSPDEMGRRMTDLMEGCFRP